MAQVNVSTTPTNRVAVLEEYTGNFCTYCPDGHLIATDDVEPTGAITLKIQTGGFSGTDPVFGGNLQTNTGNTIAGPYDSQGYPNGSVSRSAGNTGIGRGDWLAAVNGIQSQVSPVNLYVEADVDVTTRQLDVSVEYYYTGTPSSGSNYLHIGYYQDNIPAYQFDPGFNPNQFYIISEGVYDFDHCFRDMINGTWGEELTGLANGSTSIINHSITLPASFSTFDIEPGAIKVYAFMSDSPQGEIITAAKATPTFTNWPNVDDAGIVFSTATNDENCVGQPGSFGPTVLVGNYSAADLTSFDINYGVNGGSSSDSWSGTLGHNEKVAVNLAATNFTYQASNTLDVTLTNPNGTTDPNTANNNVTSNFSGSTTTANASKVRVEVKGDGYMVDEATLTVRDGSGTALLTVTGNQWTDNSTQTWDIDVPNGVDCYTFELEDTYGDGWGYQTTSWCRVYNFTGDVQGALIKDIDSDNTLESQLTEAAELTSTLSVEEVDAWEVSVYPNPASSALNVTFNATSNDYVVEVMDLQGRTILSQGLTSVSGAQEVNFDVNGIASGSYILNVKSATGVYTQNVVIK
jgi:hypothetical protein